jgi:hypothetical protein
MKDRVHLSYNGTGGHQGDQGTEVFALLLGIPVILIASLAYSSLVSYRLVARPRFVRWLVLPTLVVLCLLAAEVAVLQVLGPERTFDRYGRSFLIPHLFVFILGAPAVANATILFLRAFDRFRSKTLLQVVFATALCFLVGVGLLFNQYSVSERIFGVDGDGKRPEVWL